MSTKIVLPWRTRVPLLALAGTLLLGDTLLAHPGHASIAEAQWNAATRRLEVALQVNAIDLEQVLRRESERPVDLDKSAGLERMMQDYLAKSFVVRAADGKPAKLIWVGYEVDLKDAWLYFEVPLNEGPERVRFADGVFLELLPDQTNTINFRVGKLRKSLTCTADQLEIVFRTAADD